MRGYLAPMNNDERAAVGHLLVTLTNRINEQDIIIGEISQDIAWIKLFIQGLPKIVEGDN
jgi:hypothetical protein